MEQVLNEKYIFDSLNDEEKITFSKSVNILNIIDRLKKLNYISPHKFFNHFLNEMLNESAVIVAIKIFYDGVLKREIGEWVYVDYSLNNMQDMENVQIKFEIKKFYNRKIDFQTTDERNSFIKNESQEAKITLFNIIKELKETLPFLELLDMTFEKTLVSTFNSIVDLHLDKKERKLKISIEELSSIIFSEMWGQESVVVKENLYKDYNNESDI